MLLSQKVGGGEKVRSGSEGGEGFCPAKKVSDFGEIHRGRRGLLSVV